MFKIYELRIGKNRMLVEAKILPLNEREMNSGLAARCHRSEEFAHIVKKEVVVDLLDNGSGGWGQNDFEGIAGYAGFAKRGVNRRTGHDNVAQEAIVISLVAL